MTHQAVTRAMLVFTGSMAAAAVAFGCLANRPVQPVAGAPTGPLPGEALFQSHCVGCHTIDEAVLYVRAAADPDAARSELTALLAAHGDSSADEDRLIVDYVLSLR